MKLSTFLAIVGGIGVLFGAFFLAVPDVALRQYGVPTEPHNLMQARYFGAALLTGALVTWLARDTQEALSVRALLVGLGVGNALGAAIGVWAGVAGLQNAMVWGSVLLYAAVVAGCAYFILTRPRLASGVA